MHASGACGSRQAEAILQRVEVSGRRVEYTTVEALAGNKQAPKPIRAVLDFIAHDASAPWADK